MKRICEFLVLFTLFVGMARAQDKPVLDKVVAVVGNEIILKSELDYQVQMVAYQNKMNPDDPSLRQKVLESLIDEKLILQQAVLDSVTVPEDEVNRQLDSRIEALEKQVGGEKKLEEIYGMSLSKIRNEFREDMRKQLIVEKLKQQKFGNLSVSAVEVRNFYDTYKDSLPEVPEQVSISHIFIVPKPSEQAKKEAYDKAEALLDSLKHGADFAELAKKYSQDPGSASAGGDLGWAARGQFIPEFEHAVYALKPGEISGVVETQFGFHIIQLLARRGDMVHARQILIRIPVLKSDDDSVITLLDSLRERALHGESFAKLAREYSQDKDTRDLGGDLGTVSVDQLEPSFLNTVKELKVGEISKPVKVTFGTSYGYHIVYLRNRIPAHKINLSEDYNRLEKMALAMKQNNDYLKWIAKLKKEIYWKVMS
ncbi:MAG: peptidylprolyl isomerase [Bacteroidetes bacterium]|nr:peptidylprolyl isomerase [Bacteroidota bacterium]